MIYEQHDQPPNWWIYWKAYQMHLSMAIYLLQLQTEQLDNNTPHGH